MLSCFSKITNDLISLGESVSNDHKMRKITRSLFKSWEVMAMNLKELNNSKEMNFIAFMGNLKTHD